MRKNLLYSLCILSVCATSAQEKFNLKDCITYGLENHNSVTISKNNKLATKAANKEIRSAYLPTIAINGSIDDNLKVQETVIPAGVFGDEDLRVAFTKQFTASGTIQFDQTIYDHSLLVGLKANKYRTKETELKALQNDDEIIYNISLAFYQILVYRQQLEFLNQNLEVYTEQVRISKLKVEKGVLAEVELNKVQVNLNNTLSQIRLAQANISYGLNYLKNNMGFPLEKSLEVITDTAKIESVYNENSTSVFNPLNRIEFQLAQNNAKLYKIEFQRLKATNYPKMSFYAKYGQTGFGDQVSGAFTTLQDFSAIGIKLGIPLFNGFNKQAQWQQKHIEYLNELEYIKLNEAKYRLESENATTKLIKAQSSLGEEKENIALATSVLKSTDLQYQKGVTDLNEWLNASTSLKESQNNYLKSVVDYYLAQIEVAKANGTLKKYYQTLN